MCESYCSQCKSILNHSKKSNTVIKLLFDTLKLNYNNSNFLKWIVKGFHGKESPKYPQ